MPLMLQLQRLPSRTCLYIVRLTTTCKLYCQQDMGRKVYMEVLRQILELLDMQDHLMKATSNRRASYILRFTLSQLLDLGVCEFSTLYHVLSKILSFCYPSSPFLLN